MVKVIHIDAKPSVRKQIVRELHIMQECHSPYIVSFYGAFLNEGDVVMCMEYMDCGSDINPHRAVCVLCLVNTSTDMVYDTIDPLTASLKR